MANKIPTRVGRLKAIILCFALGGLVIRGVLLPSGRPEIARIFFVIAVIPALGALPLKILRGIGHGETGLDIVAASSMSAALLFGEILATAVVAVMYSGGTFLESFAEGRARREMHDLVSRVPSVATRHQNGTLEDVAPDEICLGDRLLIRQSDIVPADGIMASDIAFLDTSALAGGSPSHTAPA